MAFLAESAPLRYTALPAAPGISRIVAPNPGPMTYHGTNSWIVEEADGLTVIDPGPEHQGHLDAMLARGLILRILLTHTHPDHVAGAPSLRAATGAPIHAFGAADFTPDVMLKDGQTIGGLIALHTPGHASDHLCFAQADTGILFTGDHVMSWNTSIVSPPDGDMAHYMASLRLLLAREDTLYLCGHGPPLPNPGPLVRGMLSHRAAREAAIVQTLAPAPATVAQLVAALYAAVDPALHPAAARSVLAHLLKLRQEGRVGQAGDTWRAVVQAQS